MSTAAVERLFSILNLKQQERSRLEILNELLLIRFNTEPGGHLDESSHMGRFNFFAVKKRMGAGGDKAYNSQVKLPLAF